MLAMGSYSEDLTLDDLRKQKLNLLSDFSTYARKAAKRAAFKWDLPEDDVFQELVLAAWQRAEWAMSADSPIAMLRSHIRFVIGHLVQARYWRKGNGKTDQLDETFDVADHAGADPALAIDITKAMGKLRDQDRTAIRAIYEGHSIKSFADLHKLPVTTANHRVHKALDRFKAYLDGADEAETEGRIEGENYAKQITLRSDCGRVVTGSETAIRQETGLSRGSLHNLISGKRTKVKEWSRVDEAN